MKFTLLAALLLTQFGPRAPLTPAETLLAPELLRIIERAPVEGPAVTVIRGSDSAAGEIALTCNPGQCEAVEWAARKLGPAIGAKQIHQPARTIRVVPSADSASPRTKAAIFVAEPRGNTLQIVRGLWSTAGIGDEVVELFARQTVAVLTARPYENVGQPQWDALGIPTTAMVPAADATNLDRASFVAAASAYFLATLPNPGAESLLSHLTVGAHARLAEDGRKAVAQMGNQQRASADVLIMFGQAIEREQRRMRSFEAFMPAPVDPMLRSRIADMERGITSVWTSMGITSSPFVPPADRLRGRGGEDRRVPAKVKAGPLPRPELPTAFLKFPNVDVVVSELDNFVDGRRSISDIRDAVSAEFAPIALPVVVEYFERLAKAGAISIR
jgi:hypothetical protein